MSRSEMDCEECREVSSLCETVKELNQALAEMKRDCEILTKTVMEERDSVAKECKEIKSERDNLLQDLKHARELEIAGDGILGELTVAYDEIKAKLDKCIRQWVYGQMLEDGFLSNHKDAKTESERRIKDKYDWLEKGGE